jgi:hypothetical protein
VQARLEQAELQRAELGWHEVKDLEHGMWPHEHFANAVDDAVAAELKKTPEKTLVSMQISTKTRKPVNRRYIYLAGGTSIQY